MYQVAAVSVSLDAFGGTDAQVAFDHVLTAALSAAEFLPLLLLEGRKGEEDLPLGIPLEECVEEVVSYRGGGRSSTV